MQMRSSMVHTYTMLSAGCWPRCTKPRSVEEIQCRFSVCDESLGSNASAMKRLAARDFEDLLPVSYASVWCRLRLGPHRSSPTTKSTNIIHILQVNHTTYDLRREQDTINPSTRADIMVLSHKDERTHPYWYARVLGIMWSTVETRFCCSSARSAWTFVCAPVQGLRRDVAPAGLAAT